MCNNCFAGLSHVEDAQQLQNFLDGFSRPRRARRTAPPPPRRYTPGAPRALGAEHTLGVAPATVAPDTLGSVAEPSTTASSSGRRGAEDGLPRRQEQQASKPGAASAPTAALAQPAAGAAQASAAPAAGVPERLAALSLRDQEFEDLSGLLEAPPPC